MTSGRRGTPGYPAARFWDRIAARYARQPIADVAVYEKKLEVTRGYLRPDMEVIEIGCGTGSTAIRHAPHVRHIRAVDVSPRMLDVARSRAKEAGVANVTFECATVDELEAGDGSVGAVLALSILHLLEDRDAAIARVHGWLEPGGVFVTSTACLGDSWYRVIGLVAPLGRLFGVLPLVRIFTRKQLEESLVGAGFEIDYGWQPGPGKAVFIVARKPARV